jgi:hypothetical protein
MLQELETFRKAFRANIKEKKKVHGCKGVKLWTPINYHPPKGKTKGTRSTLILKKETTLTCLFYYDNSSNR